jgi:hypothetical protein
MVSGHNTGGQSGESSGSTGGRNAQGGGVTTTDAGGSSTVTGDCNIGDSKACRVVIGIYNGQESCFVGMQYCDTGTWTGCIDKRDGG